MVTPKIKGVKGCGGGYGHRIIGWNSNLQETDERVLRRWVG